MRPLALLTSKYVLLLSQQIVALWFVVDFFLARESSTALNFKDDFGSISSGDPEVTIAIKSAQYQASKICPKTEAVFDKVILTIIDALGSNFIDQLETQNVSSNQFTYTMPFVSQSLKKNKAISLRARAATPTVTMPRIKAILSGTIPSFMDIIHNLARDVSDFHQDNILLIAKAHNKSLVFYGDDTWLLMFPREMFLRAKETYSLFASDYTTVDTNVTEMALPEVKKQNIDWDFMFLHYLGLDHIGHTFGSSQIPRINDKLLEMDKVIEEIYTSMQSKRQLKTLIIVCGDHGMSKEGNHGGDSDSEANTAMIFLPVNLNTSFDSTAHNSVEYEVNQIDFAATLSVLTGLPIPRFSRGVVFKKVLDGLLPDSKTKIMCSCLENALQLAQLADRSLERTQNGPDETKLFSQTLIDIMRNNSNLKDAQRIDLASNEYHQLAKLIQNKLLGTIASKSSPKLFIVALTLVTILSLISLRRSCLRLLTPLMTLRERLICIAAVTIPIICLGSTDFIENEHAFWPIHSVLVFIMFCAEAIQLKKHQQYINEIEPFRVILIFGTFLITALWNRWSLFRLHLGWVLPALSVLILSTFSRQTSKLSGPRVALFYATGLSTLLSKIIDESNVDHDQQVLSSLAIMQIVVLVLISIETILNICNDDLHATQVIQKLATSWMWLGFLLARSNNYVFLISNVMLEASINKLACSLSFSPIARTIIYFQFSINAFYGQGNTNLFTSIDIKPAFYGQTKYHAALAIPLVASATFTSQIYWYLKLFQRIHGTKEQERSGLVRPRTTTTVDRLRTVEDEVRSILDTRNFLSLSYYICVCIVLSNHLFIWSVISPKLVYHYVSNFILQFVTLWITTVPHLISNLLTRTRESGGDYFMLKPTGV